MFLRTLLQHVLGLNNYLFIFSLFKIYTLKFTNQERGVTNILHSLSPDATVLEIGANIGILTIMMAKRCNKGIVHAIEPVPQNFHTLQRMVKFFNLENIRLYNLALGDEKKQIQMILPENNGARLQGLSHVVHPDLNDFNEGSIYPVQQERLDDLHEIISNRINVIILDVENYESFVLAGGKETINKWHPIILCEMWDNENRVRCMKIMQDLNYEVRVPTGNPSAMFEKFIPGKYEGVDFVFLPKET